MKLFSRIAALMVLVSPALLGYPVGRAGVSPPEFPFRQPITPQALLAKGSFRFAISRPSLQGFGEASGFDRDLLRRFAAELGVALELRSLDTDEQAAQALRAGMVDMAVLPGAFLASADMVSIDSCPDPAPAYSTTSKRLTAFLRTNSIELAHQLGGATSFVRDGGLAEQVLQLYCRSDADSASTESAIAHTERIIRYAPVIAKYSAAAGLDWRLVAAVIFEESTFHEKAVSPSGAQGLMQLMPGISAEVGVANISRPEANIQAGVLYLRRLADQFPEGRQSDRLAMVLASYLLGPGHVIDAQSLARGLGLDPRIWRRGLEETLPLLEDARFHTGTRLGYAHGRLAVDYVNRILERYQLYKQHLERQPEIRAAIVAGSTATS